MKVYHQNSSEQPAWEWRVRTSLLNYIECDLHNDANSLRNSVLSPHPSIVSWDRHPPGPPAPHRSATFNKMSAPDTTLTGGWIIGVDLPSVGLIPTVKQHSSSSVWVWALYWHLVLSVKCQWPNFHREPTTKLRWPVLFLGFVLSRCFFTHFCVPPLASLLISLKLHVWGLMFQTVDMSE